MKRTFALLALAFITAAHAAPPANELAGTWTLVSVENVHPDGTIAEPYGKNPDGTLMFDASGRYALMIFRAGRARFAATDKNRGTAEENAETVRGTNTHFGRYAVDGTNLIFKIDHASFPNWEGTEQRRAFTLDGDVLRYTVTTTTSGGPEIARVTWKRLK